MDENYDITTQQEKAINEKYPEVSLTRGLLSYAGIGTGIALISSGIVQKDLGQIAMGALIYTGSKMAVDGIQSTEQARVSLYQLGVIRNQISALEKIVKNSKGDNQ